MLSTSLLIAASGCAPATPTLDLGNGTLEMAMTEPLLAEAVQTWAAVLYRAGDPYPGCSRLVDMTVAELETQRQRQPTSAFAVAFTLSDDRRTTGFGRVSPPGQRAIVLLGSTRLSENLAGAECTDETKICPLEAPLPQLAGSVIAIGCGEIDVEAGQRFSSAITLFPAGLR